MPRAKKQEVQLVLPSEVLRKVELLVLIDSQRMFLVQHLSINIVAGVGIIEPGVYFTAYQVIENIRVQVQTSSKFSSLAGAHIQIDTEIAAASAAQVAIVLVGALG